jgi:hypothetical protein
MFKILSIMKQETFISVSPGVLTLSYTGKKVGKNCSGIVEVSQWLKPMEMHLLLSSLSPKIPHL